MNQPVTTFHYAALVRQIEEALISLWDDPAWQDTQPARDVPCDDVPADAQIELAAEAAA